jgi:glycosyltransferase involved in cell wall biosynthesis
MLVSVVIPAYNAASFIERTINSVLSQTYQNFEILVINDGSKDNTLEVIQKLSQKDPRIKVLDKKNSGVSDTRNLGIEMSKGDFIAFLDADDIWLPNKLEIQVSLMQKNQNLFWSVCNCDTIDENDQILEKAISKAPNKSPHFEELITWTTKSFTAMSSLMICKEKTKGVLFNSRISSPADRDFMIRLAKISDAIYIDEVLWHYRILSNSMSKNDIKVIEDMLKQYEDYEDSFYGDLKLKNKSLKRLYFIVYRTYLKKGRITKAVNYFLKYLLIIL